MMGDVDGMRWRGIQESKLDKVKVKVKRLEAKGGRLRGGNRKGRRAARHAVVGVAAGGRRGIGNHADSTEAPNASVSSPSPSSWAAAVDGVEAAAGRGGGVEEDHGAAAGYGDGVVAAGAACAGGAGEEKEAQPSSHPQLQSRSHCHQEPTKGVSMTATKQSRWSR